MAATDRSQEVLSLQAAVYVLEKQLRDKAIAHEQEVASVRSQLAQCQSSVEQQTAKVFELTNVTRSLRDDNAALKDNLHSLNVKHRRSLEEKDKELREVMDRPNAPLVLPRTASAQVEFLGESVVRLRKKYAHAAAQSSLFEEQLREMVEDIESQSGPLSDRQKVFSALSEAYLRARDRLEDLIATEETQAQVIEELQKSVSEEKSRGEEARKDCVELSTQVRSLLGEVERLKAGGIRLPQEVVRDVADMQRENLALKRKLRDARYLSQTDLAAAAEKELQDKDRQLEQLHQRVSELEKSLSAAQQVDAYIPVPAPQLCYDCLAKENTISHMQAEVNRLKLAQIGTEATVNSLTLANSQLRLDFNRAEETCESRSVEINRLQAESDRNAQEITSLLNDNQRLRSQNESLLSSLTTINSRLAALQSDYLQLVTGKNEEKDDLFAQLKRTQQQLEHLQQESYAKLVKLTADKENLLFELNAWRESAASGEDRSEVKALRSEIAGLKETIINLETAKKQLSTLVFSQGRENVAIEQQKTQTLFLKLRERLQMALSEAESQRTENKALSEAVLAAQARVSELENDAKQRDSDLQAKSEKAQKDLQSALAVQDSLRQELHRAQTASFQSLTKLTALLYRWQQSQ